ncbi:hypothetical protein [Pseudonocardia sp. ICBG601]|uniref:hypothetical protein n=1 Tax=Pseudonocardia sp. ICBG601 TaxID=2846759 RepID=UPI001CF6E4AA|nr:hypothetical protein [Pseudonocardia sp. ICBG601]
MRMCLAAVPIMREQRWGRIVAITSIGVRQPLPGLVLSNTARGGRDRLPRTLVSRRGARRRDHRQLGPARRARHRPRSCPSTAV